MDKNKNWTKIKIGQIWKYGQIKKIGRNKNWIKLKIGQIWNENMDNILQNSKLVELLLKGNENKSIEAREDYTRAFKKSKKTLKQLFQTS